MAAVHDLKIHMIGGRTDDAGAAQVDFDQEEVRSVATGLWREGRLPNAETGAPNPNAFRVREDTGSNMQIKVGSAVLKADAYVIRNHEAGQGLYVVSHHGAGGVITLTVPATDGSLPVRYGVYLYVDDASYGGTASRAFAQLTCKKGTPNATPIVPGPDAEWSAYGLLWEFELPALDTQVTNADLDAGVDHRKTAVVQTPDPLAYQVFS